MDTTNLRLNLANIVLLYDHLEHARISRDRLLDSIPDVEPQFLDLGQIIVTKYPAIDAEIIVIVEANRIEAKVDSPNEDGLVQVPKLALSAKAAVSRAELIAYGYNFHSSLTIPDGDSASGFLLRQFEPTVRKIGTQVGGDLASMSVQLGYVRDDVKYQLNLIPRPEDDSGMTVNMNVHIDARDLPTEAELTSSYLAGRDGFIQTIQSLFEEVH